jgi:PAS domain S-box-containing protein
MNPRIPLTAFSSSVVVTVAIVVALAGAMAWDVAMARQLDRANLRRQFALDLSDELRRSSSSLSRLATSYIISGDPEFRTRHQSVLAVREGTKPRLPTHGHVFSEDLETPQSETGRTGNGSSIPLMGLLRQLDPTREESQNLQEAKSKADTVAAIEVRAMALASGGDRREHRDRALRLLDEANYFALRSSIGPPLERFRASIDSRTKHALVAAENATTWARDTMIVLGALLLSILLRTYFILRRVMGASPDAVFSTIAAMGRGDFSTPVMVRNRRRESVMTWLAETQAKLEANRLESERAMRRLHESELQFRQLAENIQEVFFLRSAANGKVIYISPGYEELFGRTCESLYADPASWNAAIHPEDRRRLQTEIASSGDTGKSGRFESDYRIVRPDGTLRWIHTRGFPILDADGKLERIAGFAVDTTHQTKLEVVLRDDCERFRHLVDDLDQPCFIANSGGRITYCNNASLALTGWSRPELLGKPVAEILPHLALVPLANTSYMPDPWITQSRVVARNGILGPRAWHHIRLPEHEGEPVGTAIVGEAKALEKPAAAPISA